MSAHPASTNRGRFVATVAANLPVCKEHYRLTLRLPAFPPTFPGQFVQLACRNLDLDYSPETEFNWIDGESLNPGGRELFSIVPLLRRPFSLAGRLNLPDGSVELHILYRVVGTGTQWMSQLLPNSDSVHLIGPLGNHFTPPHQGGPAILVGGGVGIPPLLYLASTLTSHPTVFFAGALNRDLLPITLTDTAPAPTPDSISPLYNVAELAPFGIPSVITTDDGSYAFHGLVTQALEHYLDRFFSKTQNHKPHTQPTLYTCGPEPMMKRVAAIAIARNLPCQISVERSMACGMGTCQSCVIRVKKPHPAMPPLAGHDWCFRLACTDGPVFHATDLLW